MRLSRMKRRGTHMGVRVTVGLVLVMTMLLVAGPALAQGKWSQLKPIPQGEEEVYGTAAGGKMYVLGGLGAFPSWEPKMMLWSFDPATSEWKRLASIPEGIHHPGFAAVGGKLYSIGGARNPSYSTPELRPSVPVENVATNEVYDTETNTWTLARPMLTARNHHGAARIDGKIYVVGGRIGSTFIIGLSNNVSTNEVYDVAKDTWASVLGMPTPRSGVGVAVLNGRMHVLGGEAYLNDLVGTYKTHEAYDPKTNAWERLPPMPTPRHGLAVGEIGGKMYAISGSNVAGGGGPHEGVNVN